MGTARKLIPQEERNSGERLIFLPHQICESYGYLHNTDINHSSPIADFALARLALIAYVRKQDQIKLHGG
jgi:hypothetical protein